MSTRAITPALGVVLLVAVTILVAASVAVMVGMLDPGPSKPQLAVMGTVDHETNELTIEHAGGDTLVVGEFSLNVDIDGEALEHQPPIPFFSATGFRSGPTGPFNPEGADTWSPGERGTLQIASTNEPLPSAESTVTITISVEGTTIASIDLEHV